MKYGIVLGAVSERRNDPAEAGVIGAAVLGEGLMGTETGTEIVFGVEVGGVYEEEV